MQLVCDNLPPRMKKIYLRGLLHTKLRIAHRDDIEVGSSCYNVWPRLLRSARERIAKKAKIL